MSRSFYADLVREGFRAGPAVGSLVLLSQVAVGIGFIEAALAERRSTGANTSGVKSAFVLYDRDCGFCRWSLARVLAWDRRRRLRPVALQAAEAERLLPGLEREDILDSAHLVLPDGTVYSGGDAVAPLLLLLPGGWPFARLAQAVEAVTGAAYAWVARHRRLLGRPLSEGAKARATERIDRLAASRRAKDASAGCGAASCEAGRPE